MKEQTIVGILGIALVVWWMTSGREKVNSIQSDVAKLRQLATPWTEYRGGHAKNSILYTFLTQFVAEARELLDMATEHFQEMRQIELMRYFDTSLVRVAERLGKFADIIEKAEDEVEESGAWVDGPFRLTDETELEPLDDFVDTFYRAIGKTRNVGVEILQKLGVPPEELKKLTSRLDVLVPE